MTDVPFGWVETTLGDVVEPDTTTVSAAASGMPYLGLDGVEAGSTRIVSYAESESIRGPAKPFGPGYTLYARLRPYLNKVCGPDRKGVASTEFIVFSPSTALAPRYLLYLLNSQAFVEFANSKAEGIERPRLSWQRMRAFRFALPPLAEQRRIVEAIEEHLSRLEIAVTSLSRLRASVAAFHTAASQRLLSKQWPRVSLGELALRVTKGTTPTSLGHRFVDTGIRFVKAESLVRGRVDHSRCAFIDRETDKLLARSRLEPGDVLVTIAGTLGRVAVVRAEDVPANTNQAVAIVRLKDRSLASWIATVLRGPWMQGLLRVGGRGVGLQNLNLAQVRALEVPIPPADERSLLEAELDRLESIVAVIETRLAEASARSGALRKAILWRAFRGTLVLQDANDEPASALLDRIAAERSAAPKAARKRRQKAPA